MVPPGIFPLQIPTSSQRTSGHIGDLGRVTQGSMGRWVQTSQCAWVSRQQVFPWEGVRIKINKVPLARAQSAEPIADSADGLAGVLAEVRRALAREASADS